MPEFFAATSKGLSEALQQELIEIGVKPTQLTAGGVYFESNWEGCYRVNLYSRIASRVLKPVLDFYAYQPEELYEQIRTHNFTKYIKPDQTFSIEASVSDRKIHDQRFLAMSPSNKRNGGDGGAAPLRRAGRPWPAAPHHER